VSKELSKYKLDLVRVQDVRWEGGGRRIHISKRIITAVKRV
jgi:hypothetical protein